MELATTVEVRNLRNDDVLCMQGAEIENLWLLSEGAIRLGDSDDAGQTSNHLFSPSLVGLSELVLDSGKPTWSLEGTCMTDSVVLGIPFEAFRQAAQGRNACLHMLAELSTMVRDQAHPNDYPHAQQRIAGFLLSLIDRANNRNPSLGVKADVTQVEIAKRLSITDRTVGRVFSSWQSRGWIAYHKGWLCIRNVGALAQVCRASRYKPPYQKRNDPEIPAPY